MRSDPEALARLALSRLAEPGDAEVGAWVRIHDAVGTLERWKAGELGDDRLAVYRARAPLDVEADLDVASRCGARLLVPGDDEWPTGVDDLHDRRPLLLWVRGQADLADATARAVAVVGARACTAYGAHVAGELAAGLAERGWTVVSGGAFGIDAAAHRGAMAVDGVTVAVLACGIDQCYPAAHDQLIHRVAETGAVVSELPPGAHPTRLRFLERNRVIAALARGTVVVEAAIRSGARRTASQAEELSRVVMAVPGQVTSAASAGCHLLIREHGAALVTDAADVIDLVGELGTDAAPERRGPERPEDALDPDTLRVLEALPVRRFAAPDTIAAAAGVDGTRVLRGLALLGTAGLAESRDGAWRRVRAVAG